MAEHNSAIEYVKDGAQRSSRYGVPKVDYRRGFLGWDALVKVPAAPMYRRRGKVVYLGHVDRVVWGPTRRIVEWRVDRAVRRLHKGKCFVF